MIKTKTAIKREARNGKIIDLYISYRSVDGSMKSAVVEQVAKETKTSVSTVNRIVKDVVIDRLTQNQ